jgi:hypothetical protein
MNYDDSFISGFEPTFMKIGRFYQTTLNYTQFFPNQFTMKVNKKLNSPSLQLDHSLTNNKLISVH